MKRRHLLQAAGLGALPIATAVSLFPRNSLAAWPSEAFQSETLGQAQSMLFDDLPAEPSELLSIEAPDIAENGRVVPIELRVELPNPRSVTLFSRENPFPLLARAHFSAAVAPKVSFRVKLGQSTELIAIAEADGSLFSATRNVKVTAGGCGG